MPPSAPETTPAPTTSARRTRRRPLGVVAATAAVACLATSVLGGPSARAAGDTAGAQTAEALTSTKFLAGVSYRGSFPDPTVLRDGRRFLVSGTSVANLNLPLATSTDLVHVRPRGPVEDVHRFSTWKLYNESMVVPPAWAAVRGRREGVPLISQWAPSLATVQGRYLAAFSAAQTLSPRHSCISIASSATAIGQYVDPHEEPLICVPGSALGAIDPEFFVGEDGRPWLLWKGAHIPGVQPGGIMAQALTDDGMDLRPGTQPRLLLQTRRDSWEGTLVENPSMIRYRGTTFLFYSANSWRTGAYATGVAVCRSVRGGCRRVSLSPVLRSTSRLKGPGGADAFVDKDGRLRLAFHAWDAGHVGIPNPRRLHFATLATRDNRVLVTSVR